MGLVTLSRPAENTLQIDEGLPEFRSRKLWSGPGSTSRHNWRDRRN
jgi:hypothetical protein